MPDRGGYGESGLIEAESRRYKAAFIAELNLIFSLRFLRHKMPEEWRLS